jgi:hypothetical protein
MVKCSRSRKTFANSCSARVRRGNIRAAPQDIENRACSYMTDAELVIDGGMIDGTRPSVELKLTA